MRRATVLLLALALVGCAPTNDDQSAAATAVAQVKGGLDAQRKAVEALGTQVPGSQEKIATVVADPAKAATQAAVSPEKAAAVATAAVATVQAVAPNVKPPLQAGGAPMSEDQIKQIAQDALARALNVPAGQVAVERVESVEWNDASLGCPQPGMMYAQVITPGFRVIANVNGQRKEVHADRAGHAVVCDRPSP
ncbi:MAG TPA: hypothetical protein VGM69_04250 [Chloroflexota bacterium]